MHRIQESKAGMYKTIRDTPHTGSCPQENMSNFVWTKACSSRTEKWKLKI